MIVPDNIKLHQMKLNEIEANAQMTHEMAKAAKQQSLTDKREILKEIKLAEKELAKNEHMKAICEELEILIERDNIYQMGSGRISWWIQPVNDKRWISVYKDTLVGRYAILADSLTFIEFTKLMSDKNRIVNRVIKSWNTCTDNATLNQLERNFAVGAADNSIDYNWIIDAVVQSITGGKKEAIESLEKTIWCKYLHPENYMLPNPFFNDGGETGKSLYVGKFIYYLFGGLVITNGKMDDLLGKFNGSSSGQAIMFVNETVKETIAVDRFKAFLGSEKFMLEEKFQPKIECDNTALVIGASNDKAGAIMLTGTKTDRRFSIFSSKSTLNEIVLSYLVLHKEKFNDIEFTIDTKLEIVAEWIKDVGQHRLSDLTNIGKWINAMQQKYSDVKTVAPYHGDDYKTLLTRQRPAWLDTVEKVFEDPNFKYIRNFLLIELIKEFNKSEKYLPGKKRMKEQIEQLITEKGYSIEYDNKFNCTRNCKSTSANIWKIPTLISSASTVLTDDHYGHTEQNGRWIWDWTE